MNQVVDFINVNRDRYVDELKQYLAIPSISALPQHAADVRRAAEWTGEALKSAGLQNVRLLETLHAEDVRTVLSVPIGFVCDHLEVLFDIDHEAAEKAAALGMTLRRTRMPNATLELIAVLEALVARASHRHSLAYAAAAGG